MTEAADPRATWRALLASAHFGEYVLLCSGILLHASDTLVTATLMPAAVAQIGGVAYINWTIALYQIGSILMGATGGRLARRHGLRPLFVAGAVAYALGCFIAALAPHMAAMLVGRLVQGLGGGLMLSLSYLAVQLLFPRALWPKVYALSAAIWSVACLIGPLIGGLFADAGLWRGAFWVFGLPALALSLAATRYLRTAQPAIDDGSSISWPALAWLTAAVVAIAEAGALAQLRYSLPLGCAGAAMLALAAIADRGASQHLFPRQLTELRTAVGQGLLMVAALSAGTTAFWAYGPLVLKVAFSIDPLIPGILMAVESLLWSVATIIVTTLRGDETVCIRSGVSLASLGGAGLAVAMPFGSLPAIGVCLALQGAGFGVCWPFILRRLILVAPPADQLVAGTATPAMQRIGYAVGAAATGIAANAAGLADGISPAAARAAGTWVFAAFVPVLAVAVAASFGFTQPHQRDQLSVR